MQQSIFSGSHACTLPALDILCIKFSLSIIQFLFTAFMWTTYFYLDWILHQFLEVPFCKKNNNINIKKVNTLILIVNLKNALPPLFFLHPSLLIGGTLPSDCQRGLHLRLCKDNTQPLCIHHQIMTTILFCLSGGVCVNIHVEKCATMPYWCTHPPKKKHWL